MVASLVAFCTFSCVKFNSLDISLKFLWNFLSFGSFKPQIVVCF